MQVLLEFLEYLENCYGLAYNSLRLYKRDLFDFDKFIQEQAEQNFKIENLSKENLEEFSEYIRKQGSSTATVNRKLSALKKFWDWLREQGRAERDPFSQIFRSSQFRNNSFEYLSEEEVNSLLDCENCDLETKLILELLYSSGLRINELLNLTLDDIALEEKSIQVKNSRSNKIRLLPITDLLQTLLKTYIEEKEISSAEKLFKISAREVYRMVQKIAKEVGINKKITASTLRNSFIKHMKERGAHKVFIQDLIGQKNINKAVI